MEHHPQHELIIDKISKGQQFGMFEDGAKCYFEDGVKVSYSSLWAALRDIYQLPAQHHKTLKDLCPDAFAGSFSYGFSRHKWKKAPAK